MNRQCAQTKSKYTATLLQRTALLCAGVLAIGISENARAVASLQNCTGNGAFDYDHLCIGDGDSSVSGKTYSLSKLDSMFAAINAQIAGVRNAPVVSTTDVQNAVSSAVVNEQKNQDAKMNSLQVALASQVDAIVKSELSVKDTNLPSANQRELDHLIRSIVRDEIQKALGTGI